MKFKYLRHILAVTMIAGGIFGMHLGLSLHTRECTENTAS